MYDLSDQEYNRMEWSNLFGRIDQFSFDVSMKIYRNISIRWKRYSYPQFGITKQKQSNKYDHDEHTEVLSSLL